MVTNVSDHNDVFKNRKKTVDPWLAVLIVSVEEIHGCEGAESVCKLKGSLQTQTFDFIPGFNLLPWQFGLNLVDKFHV